MGGGYTSSLINWALSMFGWNMQVTKRRQRRGFEALPKRRIVRKTFSWLSQSRRLSKDYEVNALFSRSIREDCLHSARGQAFGTILRTVSEKTALCQFPARYGRRQICVGFQGFDEMTDACLKQNPRPPQDSGESIFMQSGEKTDGMIRFANRTKDKDAGFSANVFNAKNQ